MRTIIILSIVLLLASCVSSSKEPEKVDSSRQETAEIPVREASIPDSIDLVYYKKPFTDPERYSRFFKTLRVNEPSLRDALNNLLALPGVRADSVRKCMSEGKILLPLGGEAFKTVYFSRTGNRECKYLYVIRNGAFYYYDIPDTVLLRLDQYEKQAKEPLSSSTIER